MIEPSFASGGLTPPENSFLVRLNPEEEVLTPDQVTARMARYYSLLHQETGDDL